MTDLNAERGIDEQGFISQRVQGGGGMITISWLIEELPRTIKDKP